MSDANHEDALDESWKDDEERDGDGDDGDDGDDAERAGDATAVSADDDAPEDDGEARPPRRERSNGGRRRRRREDDYVPEDDEPAMAALKFMSDVVREMEMDCRVRLRRPQEDDERNEITLEIVGRDAGRVIGKRGLVLAALQFLAHRVVNRPGTKRRPILVDAEGYRSRRDNSLASMARRLGKQAVDEGKIITFEPMNPRDRRVIHLALAKFEGVITKSDGEGEGRRVQIIPVRRQD